MKAVILYICLSIIVSAQPDNKIHELSGWKFIAFQGTEKVYYLPASLRSVGDIFRVKLLCRSEGHAEIQYTVFVEDYNRVNATNRVVQVNTYNKFWQPVDEINIERSGETEQWVHIKKGTEPYKLFEKLLAGVENRFED